MSNRQTPRPLGQTFSPETTPYVMSKCMQASCYLPAITTNPYPTKQALQLYFSAVSRAFAQSRAAGKAVATGNGPILAPSMANEQEDKDGPPASP